MILCILPFVAVMFLFGGRPLTLPNRTLQLSVIQPVACRLTVDAGRTHIAYAQRMK